MILTQKKANVTHVQDVPERFEPQRLVVTVGAALGQGRPAMPAVVTDESATAAAPAGEGREEHFDVDLLEAWCKP